MMPLATMHASRVQLCSSRGGRRLLEHAKFLPSSCMLRNRSLCQAVKAEQQMYAPPVHLRHVLMYL